MENKEELLHALNGKERCSTVFLLIATSPLTVFQILHFRVREYGRCWQDLDARTRVDRNSHRENGKASVSIGSFCLTKQRFTGIKFDLNVDFLFVLAPLALQFVATDWFLEVQIHR